MWLAANGGAIYGTRAGPIAPRSWGVVTQRSDTVFVHVLEWSDPTLALPSLGAGRWRAKSWPDGKVLQVMQATGGVTITLPAGGGGYGRGVGFGRPELWTFCTQRSDWGHRRGQTSSRR